MQHLDFTVGCIRNEDTEFYVKYMVNIENIVVSDYKGYFYRPNPYSCMNSKLDVRSFTSIEAQERMAKILVDKDVFLDTDRVLATSVQTYTYLTARKRNYDLYDLLHKRYDVRNYMNIIFFKHPRLVRKGIGILYLLLGKKRFYKIISIGQILHI